MKIRCGLTCVGLTAAMLLATPAAALAAWDITTRDAEVTARASVVPALRDPVAVAVGGVVTVAWKKSTFPAARGYRVTRIHSGTGQTMKGRNGCSGLLTRPVCVELGVPDGHWKYAVEVVVGADWRSERAVGRTVRVFRIERDSAPTPTPTPTPTPEPLEGPSTGIPVAFLGVIDRTD